MAYTSPIEGLVTQLTKLPGVGAKSAQRLAFFLLSLPQSEVDQFSSVIQTTRKNIKYCKRCFNLSFESECFICKDPNRVQDQLCVVAQPKDIMAFERSGSYKGIYHVLGGLISPLEGMQPEMLRIQELQERCQVEKFSEIILAINPTIEGDVTSLYLIEALAPFGSSISKLAYGLPVGSDIDYADEMTLQKAMGGRRSIEETVRA